VATDLAANAFDPLLRLAHDGFTAMSWIFTAITVIIVTLCLLRLRPRRVRHPVAPPARTLPPTEGR
jgi:hypothetical protein